MLRQEDGEGKLSTGPDFTYTCSGNVFGDVGREDSSSGGRIEIICTYNNLNEASRNTISRHDILPFKLTALTR